MKTKQKKISEILLSAFREQQTDILLEHFHQDIQILIPGPKEFSFNGKFNGLNEAKQMFDFVFEFLIPGPYEISYLLEDENKIAICGYDLPQTKKTSETSPEYEHWTYFLTFKDNKVIHLLHLYDTFLVFNLLKNQ